MRVAALSVAVAATASACLPASWGAGALLHPARRRVTQERPVGAEEVESQGAGVKLRGWLFRGPQPRRGTVIYLHGSADNRASGVWTAEHFLERGFTLAEATARFKVDEVDPARAASSIAVPVLLIHGANDRETPVEHSRRIHRRLRGPKKLLEVPAAGHNDALRPEVWREIDAWIGESLAGTDE